MGLPEKGIIMEEIMSRMDALADRDLPWHDGRTWGYVYDPGPEIEKVGHSAYLKFLNNNALDFTVYPSSLQFEKDLVSMAAGHAGGDKATAGSFTSGGTESIMLAVKAARDYYRFVQPEITQPEMILPLTGHAAFHKAARYFDVKIVPTEVDRETFRADPQAVRDAVTPNTIMIVGSAPSYAHGVVDPIRELGRIALEKDVWLHCDACVGGVLLPYFRKLGAEFPDYDFSVPGVTSLSMDLHKYGYTPKGASLILYRNKDFKRFQIFATASWPGYTVINNTIQSSKTSGPVAAAWAVVNYIGEDGYLELAGRSYEATKKLVEGIARIDGLRLMAKPDFCLLSFTSDKISIFNIIDEMRTKRWYIQPQFCFGPSRENIHLSIGASNAQWIEPFLRDLEECTKKAADMESGQYASQALKYLESLDPSVGIGQAFDEIMKIAGFTENTDVPERWAPVNEILNALPVEIRELALAEYLNDVFQPKQ